MTLPRSILDSPHQIVLYQAENLVNGKKYIGITGTGFAKRVVRHFKAARMNKKGALIGAAIRKYGQKNIRFRPLVVCPTVEYAKTLEISAIAKFKPEYNLTSGGDGATGYKHTEEHKAYMSAIYKGRPSPTKGMKHSAEAIENMRAAALRDRAVGKGGARKGQKYNITDEDRAARSERARGNTYCVGKKLPPEHIIAFCLAGSKSRSKSIVCVETGETFPSLVELSRSKKHGRSELRKAINAGKPYRGFTYQFAGASQ